MTGLFFVSIANRFDKLVDGVIFYNADSTAAKSAAGDTGTIDTRNCPCKRSQNIGLLAGSLIIVTQRYV